jgi:hypothetical protein
VGIGRGRGLTNIGAMDAGFQKGESCPEGFVAVLHRVLRLASCILIRSRLDLVPPLRSAYLYRGSVGPSGRADTGGLLHHPFYSPPPLLRYRTTSAIPFHALYRTSPYHASLYRIAPCRTAPFHAAPCHTALYGHATIRITSMRSAALRCSPLLSAALRCSPLLAAALRVASRC